MSGLGWSVCAEHLTVALNELDGQIVRVRRLSEPSDSHGCIDGHARAEYILRPSAPTEGLPTPEEGQRVVTAALGVIGSVSAGVHRRIRRAAETSQGSSAPLVSPWTLVELVDAVNAVRGGSGLADELIAKTERARQREARP